MCQGPQPWSSELPTNRGATGGRGPGVGVEALPAFCTSHSPCVTAEAAIRSVRQAQAEDLARVDVDQLEKVLPQLVGAGGGELGAAA